MSVHALIESTGQKSISCDSDALLLVVVELMVAGKVNAMAVVNAAENLLGIITDHDFMRALNQNGGYLGKSIVGDWMTSNVITCSSGTKLTDAIKLMANHRIRHLAIGDGEKLIAVIGIRAVLTNIHENDEMEINVLRDIAVASVAR